MALADAAEGAYASLPQKLRDILAGCPFGCGRGCKRGCMLKFCTQRPKYSAQIFNASADCKAARPTAVRAPSSLRRAFVGLHTAKPNRAPLFCYACAAGASSFVREAGIRSAMAGSKKRSISKDTKVIKPAPSLSSSSSSLAAGGGDGPAGRWCRRCSGSGSAWTAT